MDCSRLLRLFRPALRLRRSPPRVFALCAVWVCALGFVDMITPYGFSMGVFFLMPILVAARFCGRRAGVALSLLAAAFWGWDARAHPFVQMTSRMAFWHSIERLIGFILVIILIDALLAGAKRKGRLLAVERRTSKAKSDLLSLVSHEVNNSMTMIGLAVHELEVEGDSVSRREEVCGIVKRNVSRMGIVAQNFMTEARLASGRSKLRLIPERLDGIVADIVASLQPLADDKEIAVSWSVVPRDLLAIVDRDTFGVALANLLSNAVKYTPERGRVAVDVRLREGLPRLVSVCVEDNGIGIAAQDQARVIAGFERTEAGQRAAAGFGLGLKIAYDIVKAHGGSLSIESKPGKGSRFSFLLPSA